MDELPKDDVTVKRGIGPSFAGGDMPSAAAQFAPIEVALPIGTRVREFEIQGVIGQGGFSIVYSAWDHSLHRSVALKEYIPAEFAYRGADLRVTIRSYRHKETFAAGLKSFIDEARLLANFDHRSLVKVHQFWEENGTAFMAMPWLKGPTLKQAVEAMLEPPSERWLSTRLAMLCEALAVVHAEDCYHRDISPDNIILVGSEQVPLLLDFGAARRIIGSMTQDLTVILKRGFAPIEQYGEIPGLRQGPWTDVYALAAVAHFVMRGKTPPPSVGRAINDTYVELSSSQDARYSYRLRSAVDRALKVMPAFRTSSVADFQSELGLDLPPPAAETRAIPREEQEREYLPVQPPSAQAHNRKYTVIVAASIAAAVAVAARIYLIQHRAPAVPMTVSVVPDAQIRPSLSPKGRPAGAPAAISSMPGSATPSVTAGDSDAQRTELDARRETQKLVATLEQLIHDERRDVPIDLVAVKRLQLRAEQEAAAGHFEKATVIDHEVAATALQATQRLAGELVVSYADLAKRATEANELDIAERALKKAKKLDALRH